MNLGKLTDQAKQLIGKRGGMDSVKEDAMEVKDIAQGEGSMQDKAKAAAEALKDRALRASPRTRPLPSRKSSTEGASPSAVVLQGTQRRTRTQPDGWRYATRTMARRGASSRRDAAPSGCRGRHGVDGDHGRGGDPDDGRRP